MHDYPISCPGETVPGCVMAKEQTGQENVFNEQRDASGRNL